MKLFKSITFLLITIAFFATSSCKKYPDGPLLSLYTKKHRIMGTWDVDYFSINGYDSTAYLKSKPFYGMYFFGKADPGDNPKAHYGSLGSYYYEHGEWMLKNNKNDLRIAFYFSNSHSEQLGPYRADVVVWEIRRLTEKELWLKTNYTDGREYFVKFKLYENY